MSLSPERIPLIGGSDVPLIMGERAFGKSAWDVYARVKLGVVDDSDSDAMRWGRMMESVVFDFVRSRYRSAQHAPPD
jgi:predicted phage-related endonuclease